MGGTDPAPAGGDRRDHPAAHARTAFAGSGRAVGAGLPTRSGLSPAAPLSSLGLCGPRAHACSYLRPELMRILRRGLRPEPGAAHPPAGPAQPLVETWPRRLGGRVQRRPHDPAPHLPIPSPIDREDIVGVLSVDGGRRMEGAAPGHAAPFVRRRGGAARSRQVVGRGRPAGRGAAAAVQDDPREDPHRLQPPQVARRQQRRAGAPGERVQGGRATWRGSSSADSGPPPKASSAAGCTCRRSPPARAGSVPPPRPPPARPGPAGAGGPRPGPSVPRPGPNQLRHSATLNSTRIQPNGCGSP